MKVVILEVRKSDEPSGNFLLAQVLHYPNRCGGYRVVELLQDGYSSLEKCVEAFAASTPAPWENKPELLNGLYVADESHFEVKCQTGDSACLVLSEDCFPRRV